MSLKYIKKQFLKSGKQEQNVIGEEIEQNDQTDANSSSTTDSPNNDVDSDMALKNFLDSIPISSIPGIQNNKFDVVELTIGDTLRGAIKKMLDKNVYGAPVADAISSSSNDTVIPTKKATNRYIGFLSLSTMVLWCLEELEKSGCFGRGRDASDGLSVGFFGLLDQNPSIGQTQVRELAKSFLWDPFFPMNLEDDTLFRALLLFSKHRIHVIPVTDKTNTEITGFITQNALLELLLQSSGLDWFDSIGNSPLSEFRFNNEECAPYVYAEQSVWEALQILWKNKATVVAVVERRSNELVGNFRSFDIHLLLDNDQIFINIRAMPMSEFIQLGGPKPLERNPGGFMSEGDLRLRNNFLTTMATPVTHKMAHTLQQAMKAMVATRTETSFLIDSGSNQLARALTSRNIIMEFAPPGVDTRLRGGGFFETEPGSLRLHWSKLDVTLKRALFFVTNELKSVGLGVLFPC